MSLWPSPAGGRALLAMLLTIVTIAGCGLLDPRRFELTFPAVGLGMPVDALPVVLVDHTGQVESFGIPPPPGNDRPWPDGVTTIPGQDSALVLTWIGGMCDERVMIQFRAVSGGHRIEIATTTSDGGCRMGGVVRSIVLVLSEAIDPATVTVMGG